MANILRINELYLRDSMSDYLTARYTEFSHLFSNYWNVNMGTALQ